MWGGDSESDVAEVDRLLSAGARALGTRSVPTVIRDRGARSVPPTELAEHWSRSIGAALAAGRFGAVELSAFFAPFRACVELGDELTRIHFEAKGIARRRRELLDQEGLLRARAQESGRESDLAWARGRAERARERDESIDSGAQRRRAADTARAQQHWDARESAYRAGCDRGGDRKFRSSLRLVPIPVTVAIFVPTEGHASSALRVLTHSPPLS
jgi:hypothetical protein